MNEQLHLRPFAQVIALGLKYDIFTIHTTISDIYEKFLYVHEVDKCLKANVKMFGLLISRVGMILFSTI